MNGSSLAIIIAAAGGLAVAVQAQLMGLMDRGIGSVGSVFITYCGGGLLIVAVMLLLRGGNLAALRSVPWYAFTSGVFGLIIVGAIGFSVPRLGLVTAMTILIAAQLATGALLDHFGLLGAAPRPLDLTRLLGLAAVVGGIFLTMR